MRAFVKQFMFTEQVSISSQTVIKRCYKEARVEMASNPINPFHQWILKLDGKSIKTQKRNNLAVPSPQLAAYIAAEFNNQNQNMSFLNMPLLLLASHAVDLDYDSYNREIIETNFMTSLQNDLILKKHINQDKFLQIETQIFDSLLARLNRKLSIQIDSKDVTDQEHLNKQSQIKLESYIRGINNWQLVSLNKKIGKKYISIKQESLQSCIIN